MTWALSTAGQVAVRHIGGVMLPRVCRKVDHGYPAVTAKSARLCGGLFQPRPSRGLVKAMLAPTNYLLNQIEEPLLATFEHRFQRLVLQKGAVIHEAGADIDYVYFPETAVLAVGSETLDGEFVNVDLVGPEGVFGAFEACGSRQGFARVTVQVPGAILRLAAPSYRELFDRSTVLREAIHKHCEMLLVETRQSVACNALHTVDARLCRAILDLSDRAIRLECLPITQEQLAQLLGVQRTTVAAAIAELQRSQVLRGGRGSIEILDRTALERITCACRQTIAFARSEIAASTAPVCEAS